MTLKILLFCMSIGIGSLFAQIDHNAVLNATWKVNLEKATSHDWMSTSGDITINNDDMIVIPKCYEWDYYFKIIRVTKTELVLERYDNWKDILTATGNYYYFKRTQLTKSDFDTLNYEQKAFYLRMNS
jgi:hypothetical protein